MIEMYIRVMKNWITFSLAVIFIGHGAIAQVNFNKQAFQFVTGKGKAAKYEYIYMSCLEADVILFGEFHNNSIIHWMQLELASDLAKDSSKKLVLGAEMIERDQQLLLDEYLDGIIDNKKFNTETKLWKNHNTDYKPLVDVAKNNDLRFIATNVPRILAKQTARFGIDSFYTTLNDSIKQLLAPTPIPLDYKAPGYKELLEMDFGGGHGMDTRKMVQAQAIKDATMADGILKNLNDGERFLHFQGNFHSKNNGGIGWYLKEYDKSKKVVVISVAESNNMEFNKEWKNLGDFIMIVPSNMNKSY